MPLNSVLSVFFIVTTTFFIYSRDDSAEPTALSRRLQYEAVVKEGLEFQGRADSLSGEADRLRNEFRVSTDSTSRRELETMILNLERESRLIQNQANNRFLIARDLELKILSEEVAPYNTLSLPVSHLSDNNQALFLYKLGNHDLRAGLSEQEISSAELSEDKYTYAVELMAGLEEAEAEIRELQEILESNPRRRERRRTERSLRELSEVVFTTKMIAMAIFEEINILKFAAASNILEEVIHEIEDSLTIDSIALLREDAITSFNQADSLSQIATTMRSDLYSEEYIIRSHEKRQTALSALEEALDLYRESHQEKEINLQPGETNNEKSEQIDFGFQLYSSTPYSAENPIPGNVIVPGGLVYSIQIGIYNMVMAPAFFGGLYPLMLEHESGEDSYRYFAGLFESVVDADKALILVKQQGFADAFPVAWNNGVRITVNRAGQMERARIQEWSLMENDVYESVIEEEGDGIISDPDALAYKLQLGAFRELLNSSTHNRWELLVPGKVLEYYLNNNNLYVYTVGNFNTFEEAVEVREIFMRNGVPDAFIIPYRGNTRITIDEAREIQTSN